VVALNVAMHGGGRTIAECLTEVLPRLREAAACTAAGRFGRVRLPGGRLRGR